MPSLKELLDPNRHVSINEWRGFALGMYDKLSKIENEDIRDAGDLSEEIEKVIQREVNLTDLTTQELLQFTDRLIQLASENDMSETGYKLIHLSSLLSNPVTKSLEKKLEILFRDNQGKSNETVERPNYEIMQMMRYIEELADLLVKVPSEYSTVYSENSKQHYESLKSYFEDPQWATRVLVDAQRVVTTLADQLTALFHNCPELGSCIKLYIDEQKKFFMSIVKTNDSNALIQYVQPLNLVAAIGDTIAKYPEIVNQFKQSNEELRGIVLLAEQLQILASKDPEKAQAIHQALTAVLAYTPNMTFDKLVEEMRTNTDENNDFGKLKTAMGKHRSLFWKIVNYFYPVDTATLKYFKEQIQNMKSPLNDTGLEENLEQTRTAFRKSSEG